MLLSRVKFHGYIPYQSLLPKWVNHQLRPFKVETMENIKLTCGRQLIRWAEGNRIRSVLPWRGELAFESDERVIIFWSITIPVSLTVGHKQRNAAKTVKLAENVVVHGLICLVIIFFGTRHHHVGYFRALPPPYLLDFGKIKHRQRHPTEAIQHPIALK